MMYSKNYTKHNKGFTIVELLVVIVVIGILAAITMISYANITSRANAASAKTTANSVVAKVNTYITEGPTGTYPLTGTEAISATASSQALNGVTVSTNGAITSSSASTNVFSYQLCGTTSSTTSTAAPGALYDITNPTGALIGYWDYSAGNQATIAVGNTVAGSVGPYVSGTTTYNNLVSCYYTDLPVVY